ncbi:hypothetical protein CspeluHIS016_0201520 [Cutaneotrichosporon spelunceum]|uniref:Uncharacterized protein n=1 Tax=Cutaneotrichosporon spelunceum TaxID=1672016 RepID=A0AAD3TRB8_9TREE|nr:hypothetical protein CspeluHIS016_0201520 [Cutaneotrichosporon spelunceum]
MIVLTSMALRKSGGAIANKQKVSTRSPSCHSMPLVLPQERWHSDAPFVRGSSQSLPINPIDMAHALDLVNEALVTSPQMTAVQFGSIAAGILVPGLGTVTAAAVGTAAHIGAAKDRVKAVKKALEEANAILGIAGLHASILTTAQLHKVLGMPLPRAEELLGMDDAPAMDDGGAWSADDKHDEDEPPAYEEVEGQGKNTEAYTQVQDQDQAEDGDNGKGKARHLPLGLDRLRPYAAHVLPVDVYLGPANYTHEGRTDMISKLGAVGQTAMSSWNERQGEKPKGGKKRAKLVDEAIWFVVVFI